jgi:iron(III) transport system ATP-binding protein
MNGLEVEGLTKSFGRHAVLRGVNLHVPAGELVAILGESGGGKTTLLRLICGFERASGGTIRIGDVAVCGKRLHVKPEQRGIGYVAQEGALFPHLSVAENIVFGLRRHDRRTRHGVAELLELVGLSAAFATRAPQALSGGEQQRVALARALARRPSLVLLDEPFSALDAGLRAETRQAVAAALAAAGATALLVTHDQTEALSMGHLVGVLRDGVLAQVARPEELYRRPIDRAMAQFVGAAVLLPGVARDGAAVCVLGRVALAVPEATGKVELMLRPEQIRLVPPGEGPRARVLAVTFQGHDAVVRLACLDDASVDIAARVPGHASPQPGVIVGLMVEGTAMAFAAQGVDQGASRGATAALPVVA